MSAQEVTVQGTLNPDGTLQLDQKPSLAPGRVTVVLRQGVMLETPQEDWFQHLQRIRAEREASGYPFLNEEQVAAYIEEMRANDDRIEEAYRQATESAQ